ncbi:hypothetical protein Sjap_026638 [Stephania japonica]|uniref:NAC domain-containing protein n=1 Tax=Stephania japonica TaxID=461633 RepID=A0AAP0DV36_9MAGN
MGRDSNTVGLRGGRRGRRPQTASYRKSKESTRVTNASDVTRYRFILKKNKMNREDKKWMEKKRSKANEASATKYLRRRSDRLGYQVGVYPTEDKEHYRLKPIMSPNHLSDINWVSTSVLPRGYVFARRIQSSSVTLFSKIQNPTVQFEEIRDPNNIYEYVRTSSQFLRGLYERKQREPTNGIFHRVNKKHANGSRLSRSIGRKDSGEPPPERKRFEGAMDDCWEKTTSLNYYEGRIPRSIGSCKNTSWRLHKIIAHPTRGASAKGFFEVTHDISQLSCADFLRAPGVQTPLIVRFSTVIHERGSPETLRDPRGFAVKFYTREKHANGSRLSRSIAGQKGFWRASTGVKKVRGYNGQLLGKRTPLNYYEGKNSKTDWIMQEYILAPPQDHRTPNKEDYMVPQVPYYDQYINVGEAQGGTINSEEAMLPLMIVNQGHPSALVPFVPTDDNVANMGSVNNIASTSINCSSDHHDVQDVHVNSFS